MSSSRGAALWMRQKRLALDKAQRAAEASENIAVPVDVLRRKQAQLRGDAATSSADRRPLRIVTSKTATNTLLRWTSGVPARWLASLPLRVPPSEFDALEVEPLDLELRQKVWLREKTASQRVVMVQWFELVGDETKLYPRQSWVWAPDPDTDPDWVAQRLSTLHWI